MQISLLPLSSESRGTPTHDLALTDQLGIELAPVQRQIDVKVDTIEGTLRGVHSLKILFQIFARQIRREGHDFFDSRVFGVFGAITVVR